MILYRGEPIRQGNAVHNRIPGRQGAAWRSASVNLTNPAGYQTSGISTSDDPAAAFVYACNYANMPAGTGAVYAIWVDRGYFYRGIDVRAAAGIGAGAHIGGTVRDQSVINQQEHVLQSVAARQIIGWYTIVPGDPSRLGVWVDQPHWRIFRFDQNTINQAAAAIRARVGAKYPTGLSHARRAMDIGILTGPNSGVGF